MEMVHSSPGVTGLKRSLSLSIFFHALLATLFLALQIANPAKDAQPKLTWIEIQPLPKRQSDPARKQLVQTERGEQVEKAAPDAFLGERNQRVDRQTVSRSRSTVLGSSRPAGKPAERTDPERRPVPDRARPLGNLGIPLPAPAKAAADPSNWAPSGAAPQDYIKGLKESERTALSTKEYVFYGYFQRIRERLDRAWVPILRQKLIRFYKAGRQLASEMEHTTRVVVILNGEGEITRVSVVGESGTRDLDDAAVRAFNQAGPFPNPPRGIVDGKGEIEIPWEFVLRT
jgi:TonB family protein